MSMLTPPGMGGKYRIKGDKYPRMRRPRNRRRIVLAAVAAVVVLGFAGWGTLQLVHVFSGDTGNKVNAARDKRDCKPVAKPSPAAAALPPKPAQITVNVYNATPRGGLAKSTADELKKRGFLIGKVGNAPAAYDKKVPGAGMLLGSTAAQAGSLRTLSTQLAGAQLKADTRATADVDLIIGTAFKALTPPKDSTAALAVLAKPVAVKPSC
ncbi:LytR C-terminal domain-containing protein [Streptomyces sp. NPDC001941]|uniref:LytR C-terminal domain-containing protein n=1 Tax=Streptomyces sp. NPDC001941 TaxID=3154659 RepID=UPI00332FE5CC